MLLVDAEIDLLGRLIVELDIYEQVATFISEWGVEAETQDFCPLIDVADFRVEFELRIEHERHVVGRGESGSYFRQIGVLHPYLYIMISVGCGVDRTMESHFIDICPGGNAKQIGRIYGRADCPFGSEVERSVAVIVLISTDSSGLQIHIPGREFYLDVEDRNVIIAIFVGICPCVVAQEQG